MSIASPKGPAGSNPAQESSPAPSAQAHRVVCSRGVAQPGSAPQWGCGGREFESRRPDQSDTPSIASRIRAYARARWRVLFALPAVLVVLAACTREDPRLAFDRGDYARALTLSRAAAEHGDASAMNLLGIQYYLGAGVARDFAVARQWFEKAAWGGNAQAQLNLGLLLMRGLGVERNLERAYAWLDRARRAGNTRAPAYLEIISLQITPNQIMLARGMLAEEEKSRARQGDPAH